MPPAQDSQALGTLCRQEKQSQAWMLTKARSLRSTLHPTVNRIPLDTLSWRRNFLLFLCILPTTSCLWGWKSPGLDPASATMALGQSMGFGKGEGRPSRWVRKWGKSGKMGKD